MSSALHSSIAVQVSLGSLVSNNDACRQPMHQPWVPGHSPDNSNKAVFAEHLTFG